jgi:hypothetical protein
MGDLQFLNHHPRGNELSKSSSKSGAMARRGENFPSHRPSWKISKNTIWLADCVVYIYCIKSMYYISFYLYLYRYHSNKLVSTQVHIPAWLSKKRCDFDQHEGVKESTWWCEQQKWGVNPCGIHSGINFFPSDFLLVSNWIPIWTKRETDATDVFFGNFLVEQELEPWLVRQRGLRKGVQFVTDVLAHGRQEQTQILGTTRLGFPQALKKYLGLWVHT